MYLLLLLCECAMGWHGGRGSAVKSLFSLLPVPLPPPPLLLPELVHKSIVRASIVLNQMRIHLSLVFHTLRHCSIILYIHISISGWLFSLQPTAALHHLADISFEYTLSLSLCRRPFSLLVYRRRPTIK
jgi:hypothetical protein